MSDTSGNTHDSSDGEIPNQSQNSFCQVTPPLNNSSGTTSSSISQDDSWNDALEYQDKIPAIEQRVERLTRECSQMRMETSKAREDVAKLTDLSSDMLVALFGCWQSLNNTIPAYKARGGRAKITIPFTDTYGSPLPLDIDDFQGMLVSGLDECKETIVALNLQLKDCPTTMPGTRRSIPHTAAARLNGSNPELFALEIKYDRLKMTHSIVLRQRDKAIAIIKNQEDLHESLKLSNERLKQDLLETKYRYEVLRDRVDDQQMQNVHNPSRSEVERPSRDSHEDNRVGEEDSILTLERRNKTLENAQSRQIELALVLYHLQEAKDLIEPMGYEINTLKLFEYNRALELIEKKYEKLWRLLSEKKAIAVERDELQRQVKQLEDQFETSLVDDIETIEATEDELACKDEDLLQSFTLTRKFASERDDLRRQVDEVRQTLQIVMDHNRREVDSLHEALEKEHGAHWLTKVKLEKLEQERETAAQAPIIRRRGGTIGSNIVGVGRGLLG